MHFETEQGRVHAVDDVSFAVDAGQCLGIVGESGSGKSATALSLARLLPRNARISGGSITFAERDLVALDERDLIALRGSQIAMVFQDPMTSLHPTLTVGDQITEVLRRHLALSRSQARTRAVELLAEVGIGDGARRLDSYPHHLSGGMRQRVMIAIAIACQPQLLIADEPTTALDVSVQAGVLDLLSELKDRYRMALVLITHDMGVIAQMADLVAVMYAGQIVEQAATYALFDSPEHPYTEALLGALPDIGAANARRKPLMAIPGQPPRLLGALTGCRFAPRCPYALPDDPCLRVNPPLREIRAQHWVRSDHPRTTRHATQITGGP